MYWYPYVDWYYIALVIPAMLFALWANYRVKSTFRKYGSMCNSRGMTGADAARAVLRANGVTGVQIQRVSGELTDYYDPKEQVICLSDAVYDSATPAAVGVAAHEAGHAVQYATDYAPIKFRAAIVDVTNIGSKLSVPLIVLGLLLMSVRSLSEYSRFFYYVAVFGVLCFGLCVVFQLVTLPTEYNASRRAVAAIENSRLLEGEELKGAKKVLSAAALTYVAALAVSLANLLRLALIVNRGKGRK